MPLSLQAQAEAGEHVLVQAVELAQFVWGNRLVAAYALGSLAHGGFSIHVSDIDLGLILDEPVDKDDAKAVDRLLSDMKADGSSLGQRLSVFWGTIATLSGASNGGRFPPVDLLDLKQYGRLLVGQEVRPHLRSPTLRELVVSGDEFALKHLSIPEVTARLRNPVELANASTKTLTKHVLYPVRFLFTARTGQIGMNDAAVKYFSTVDDGPAAELARKGFEWRYHPPQPGARAVADVLRKGTLPLYQLFLDDYASRLQAYGELDLAQAYREWRQRLD